MEKYLNKITCGDSYKLIKELPDKSVDCIYIDIPYLYNQGGGGNSDLGERVAKKSLELMGVRDKYINNNTTRKEALRIAKNKKSQFIDIISLEDGIDYSILDDIVRVMKKINCFIWCSKLQIFDIMKYFLGGGIDREIYFEILTWNKTNPTPTTNNTWLPDIEYCLYFKEKGVIYNHDYKLKSKWFTSPANKSDKDLFNHPTIKPLELVKRHLLHTTQPNDIVLDCFMGSGTTAVACQDTNRQFIGFEIEQKWVDIANGRLKGKNAEQVKNGQISIFELL